MLAVVIVPPPQVLALGARHLKNLELFKRNGSIEQYIPNTTRTKTNSKTEIGDVFPMVLRDPLVNLLLTSISVHRFDSWSHVCLYAFVLVQASHAHRPCGVTNRVVLCFSHSVVRTCNGSKRMVGYSLTSSSGSPG